MKRILGALFGIFAFFEVMVVFGATKYQPRALGLVDFAISSGTVTEICTSTPTAVGKPRWCTNCTAGDGKGMVCYSTSTAAPGTCDFTLSTGTICK